MPGDILLRKQAGTDDSGLAMPVVNVNLASAQACPSNHAVARPEFAGTTSYEVTALESPGSPHTNDSYQLRCASAHWIL